MIISNYVYTEIFIVTKSVTGAIIKAPTVQYY